MKANCAGERERETESKRQREREAKSSVAAGIALEAAGIGGSTEESEQAKMRNLV